MELSLHTGGFTLEQDGISFAFSGETPILEQGLGIWQGQGEIPVPEVQASDRLILPVDEGMVIQADQKCGKGELNFDRLGNFFYSREGTLAMILVERRGKFLLIALEDPLPGAWSACYQEGMYRLSMTTQAPNRVFYGIFEDLASACRCYREVRNLHPLPLTEKLRRNPNIEKLIGGGIFWVWSDHYNEVMYAEHNTDLSPVVGEPMLEVAEELHKNGVDKAMFGLFFQGDSPASQTLLDRYGYLSTQYDNYDDVLNPELLSIVPNNRVRNCDYTARRVKDYPDGIRIQADGTMANAWALKGFDGEYHSQNKLCPVVALQRMKEEIPEILRRFPGYRGRFIDVFGGIMSECFHPEHPMTREECMEIRQSAFDFLSSLGLIPGTEDGSEALIDQLVYTEGMHSPVYFRIFDSGRSHAKVYNGEQSAYNRIYMLNPACRVPLWELVYHECLLPYPYWGDSTAASPADIREKILFAVLYGTPPLYSFSLGNFEKVKPHILDSYQKITAVHEKVALLPMTGWETLTADRTVQRSTFGDKYEVIANFSETEFRWNGYVIPGKDYYFGEIKA